MYKQYLNEFLKGNLNFDAFKKKYKSNSEKNSFANSYEKAIEDLNAQVPDFNPFEKIELQKKSRVAKVKRFLPYAASVLLVLSFLIVYQNTRLQPKKIALNEIELNELQENTKVALLHFSKELNVCFEKMESAKKIQQPLTEIQSLKNIKIEIQNPTKNIKIH